MQKMVKRILINAAQPKETRVAIVENNRLIDFDMSLASRVQKKANIYKATISRVEPSLNAVFVDYGAERHGFLPIKEIHPDYFSDPKVSQYSEDAFKQIKSGQELLVQIDKEERGAKGAALTTYISLAGCYLVLMPNNPKAGGISRRIEGSDRQALKDISRQLTHPKKMGMILRTACLGRTQEELQWDLDSLLKFWSAIQEAYQIKKSPCLIYQESDVILRTVRDYLKQNVDEIIVDTQAVFEQVQEAVKRLRPDFVNRIKLDSHEMPLFSRYKIESQIHTAYAREITLPSGGAIVIDHTEALVSIDINSARATKGSDIEATALNTNIEAAYEIARQLRIRDLGGLIVIDFIDMFSQKNQREVESRLAEATRSDRARIQIGKISQFGLLEMSRQRLQPSLLEATTQSCPRCLGHGSIRTVESQASCILREIRTLSHQKPHVELIILAPVDVATFMLNENRHELDQIETHFDNMLTVIPDRHMHAPDYKITVSKHHGHSKSSYEHPELTKLTTDPQLARAYHHKTETAAVSHIEVSQAPRVKKSMFSGLFKSLFSNTSDSETRTKTQPHNQHRRAKNSTSSNPPSSQSKKRSNTRRPHPNRNNQNNQNNKINSDQNNTQNNKNTAKKNKSTRSRGHLNRSRNPNPESRSVTANKSLKTDSQVINKQEDIKTNTNSNTNIEPKKQTPSKPKKPLPALPKGAVLKLAIKSEPIIADVQKLINTPAMKLEKAENCPSKFPSKQKIQSKNLGLKVENI